MSPNVGDDTPHGKANLRMLTGIEAWMREHAAELLIDRSLSAPAAAAPARRCVAPRSGALARSAGARAAGPRRSLIPHLVSLRAAQIRRIIYLPHTPRASEARGTSHGRRTHAGLSSHDRRAHRRRAGLRRIQAGQRGGRRRELTRPRGGGAAGSGRGDRGPGRGAGGAGGRGAARHRSAGGRWRSASPSGTAARMPGSTGRAESPGCGNMRALDDRAGEGLQRGVPVPGRLRDRGPELRGIHRAPGTETDKYYLSVSLKTKDGGGRRASCCARRSRASRRRARRCSR